MEYRINPAAWGGMFALPVEVADKYMFLAGRTQLKILLWMFRHAAENPVMEDLTQALHISRIDAMDAMQYWVDCGLLIRENERAASETAAFAKAAPKELSRAPAVSRPPEKTDAEPAARRKLAPLPETKPTSEQIACRVAESPELGFLYQEAQTKLGRTIGYDGQAKLLMLHDQYGLPVEVILMLIEYAVAEGKTSLAYIEKVGRDWAEREIDSLEKAEERIAALRRGRSLWEQLKQRTGIATPRPTTAQEAYLTTWSKEYEYEIDMICLAYEEMANHTDKISFPYMNKVLANWHAQGWKTPEQVAAGQRQRGTQPSGGATGRKKGGGQASYDLDEFTRRALHEPLVYDKGKA